MSDSREGSEAVDLEPLLAEEGGECDRRGNLDVLGEDPAAEIDVPPEEECAPLERCFLLPILGRSNLMAMLACGLSFVSSAINVKCTMWHYDYRSGGARTTSVIDIDTLDLVFKSAVAVAAIELCKRLRVIRPYPDLSRDSVKLWAPVAVLYSARWLTGKAFLRSTFDSAPELLHVTGNLLVAMNAVGGYVWFGSRQEGVAVVAVSILLGSAVVLVTWRDDQRHVTVASAAWLALQCLFGSGFALYLKFATDRVRISTLGMVFVNGVLCIAFLLPAAILNGQVARFLGTSDFHTLAFLGSTFLVGLASLLLNFSVLNCVAVTGPTTYAMVGSVFQVTSSMHRTGWAYQGATLLGVALYTYAKYRTTVASGEALAVGDIWRARFGFRSPNPPPVAEPESIAESQELLEN